MHIFLRSVFGIFAFVLLYFFVAEISLFTTTRTYTPRSDKILYLYDTKEGIYSHTELILKGSDVPKKYKKMLNLGSCRYISFSYGDVAFMRDEGGFDDIDYKIALKSLFTNDLAAVKVGCYYGIKTDECRVIKIDKDQVIKLLDAIVADILIKNNTPKEIKDLKRSPTYRYYYSKSPYNLFHTCNSWVAKRLRDADIFVTSWSPLAYYLERSLDKIGIEKSKKEMDEQL